MASDLEMELENVADQAAGMTRSKTGTFFLGVLIGAVVGGGVALLLAPNTGADARAAWGGKAMQARDKLQEGFGKVKETVGRMRTSTSSDSE